MKALPKQLNGLTLIETCITVTKNVTAHQQHHPSVTPVHDTNVIQWTYFFGLCIFFAPLCYSSKQTSLPLACSHLREVINGRGNPMSNLVSESWKTVTDVTLFVIQYIIPTVRFITCYSRIFICLMNRVTAVRGWTWRLRFKPSSIELSDRKTI